MCSSRRKGGIGKVPELRRLDERYGSKDLEVFASSATCLWNEHPGNLIFIRELECAECHQSLTNKPITFTVRRKVEGGPGRVNLIKREPMKGIYLSLRPRGSDGRIIREKKFVHVQCLKKLKLEVSAEEPITENVTPVPQVVE